MCLRSALLACDFEGDADAILRYGAITGLDLKHGSLISQDGALSPLKSVPAVSALLNETGVIQIATTRPTFAAALNTYT